MQTSRLCKAAFPTGTTGIYVTSDNGHWYFWSGSAWTDGGVYQADLTITQTTGTSTTDVMSQKAVTDEIAQLAGDLSDYAKTDDIVGDLFNIKGKYIFSYDGLEGSSALINRTNYIPFKRDSGITVKGRGHSNVALIAFYDVNKEFISSISGSEYNNVLTTFESSDIPRRC